MNILLTGYSGFLGSSLKDTLTESIVFLGRKKIFNAKYFHATFSNDEGYVEALLGVECVIHCAARTHVMNEELKDPLSVYRQVNVNGTLNLAKQAAAVGVKRFIFISSIKVNGEATTEGQKFSSTGEASPQDPYGISKSEAEAGLLSIAKDSGMEVVIIRPPLIYGPGVKGNFLNLLKLSKLPIPLPFGLINNKRSMVYLYNLVDLIRVCIDHPKAANRIFLASDGDDLSLTRLLTLIRKAMNKTSFLIPIPKSIFQFIGRLTGKTEVIDRLVGDLQIDDSDVKDYLGWNAPYTVEQGIKSTVDDFLNQPAR